MQLGWMMLLMWTRWIRQSWGWTTSHVGWMAGRKASEDELGVPKGIRAVLEERALIPVQWTLTKWERVWACSQLDFKNEKLTIERFLVDGRGQIVYMLPKFHCEVKPIERVWAQAKRYMTHTVNTAYKTWSFRHSCRTFTFRHYTTWSCWRIWFGETG